MPTSLLQHPALAAALLLTASNLFMTFAWYGHLKNMHDRAWWIAALVSWGIALFEYLLQVPANRIGYTALSLGQLKIMQEVITLRRVRALRRSSTWTSRSSSTTSGPGCAWSAPCISSSVHDLVVFVTPPHFLRLYAGFATAYLLSYVYRTVNAVISPDLSADLGISASSLGLLTSAYFLAFAAMQLPAGMMLDRFGPRRVEPVLLTVAGCGALAFAASDNLSGLALARALIGAGVAVCLMAPLKAIAVWYPADRQASLSGWMMVAGGLGALLATAPLAAALAWVSWRGIFVVLALTTFAAAAILFFNVPDIPRQANAPGLAAQWRGVRSVFRNPRFWWLSPLAAIAMGSFMAIQGLWSVPWLIEVDGYTRDVAARHLLVMGIAILVGYLGLGLFATRLARRGIARAASVRLRLRPQHLRTGPDRRARIPLHVPAVGALRLRFRGQRAGIHRAERGISARIDGACQYRAQPADVQRQFCGTVGHRSAGRCVACRPRCRRRKRPAPRVRIGARARPDRIRLAAAGVAPAFTRDPSARRGLIMHLHILGICGTFMGGIAAIARQAGHTVTGCDANVYPPMSTQLQTLGIALTEGYDAAQLDGVAKHADVFVIGNVISRGNPLLEAILDAGRPYTSGPQWLAETVLPSKWVLAVAGTHGKTTATALLAWILEHAGLAAWIPDRRRGGRLSAYRRA